VPWKGRHTDRAGERASEGHSRQPLLSGGHVLL